MFGIGMPELLIILVIILIIFGAGKLPEIGGALGRGIKNFKKATREPNEIDVTPLLPKRRPKRRSPEPLYRSLRLERETSSSRQRDPLPRRRWGHRPGAPPAMRIGAPPGPSALLPFRIEHPHV